MGSKDSDEVNNYEWEWQWHFSPNLKGEKVSQVKMEKTGIPYQEQVEEQKLQR